MEETTIQTPVTEDHAMDEHRAALARMRCDFALEQLYAQSGAHNPATLARLIDIGEGDIVMDDNGIPDVTAVKNKIEVLRREQSYLFRGEPGQTAPAAAVSVSDAVPRASTGMRLGVMTQTDPAQMDDASYYRAVMARKRGRRRG